MVPLAFVILVVSSVAVFADGFGFSGASVDSDPTLIEMLTYAIQDEYAARGEYELIIEEYGEIRPFTNIIRSEETHIDLLVPLFTAHGYTVPEDTSSDYVILPESLIAAFEIVLFY